MKFAYRVLPLHSDICSLRMVIRRCRDPAGSFVQQRGPGCYLHKADIGLTNHTINNGKNEKVFGMRPSYARIFATDVIPWHPVLKSKQVYLVSLMPLVTQTLRV